MNNRLITKWKSNGLLSVLLWVIVCIMIIWLPINRWVVMVICMICFLKFSQALFRYFINKDDQNN